MKYNFTNSDIEELRVKHHDAYQFMLKRSLYNEYCFLRDNEYIANQWEKDRIKELESLPIFS